MSAEYSGKMDADKTVPILPRPLRKIQHRIRAQNLTGDPDGVRSTDNMFWWQGLDRDKMARLDAQTTARLELERAIDEAWY
jgi:hypothetical protein